MINLLVRREGNITAGEKEEVRHYQWGEMQENNA